MFSSPACINSRSPGSLRDRTTLISLITFVFEFFLTVLLIDVFLIFILPDIDEKSTTGYASGAAYFQGDDSRVDVTIACLSLLTLQTLHTLRCHSFPNSSPTIFPGKRSIIQCVLFFSTVVTDQRLSLRAETTSSVHRPTIQLICLELTSYTHGVQDCYETR